MKHCIQIETIDEYGYGQVEIHKVTKDGKPGTILQTGCFNPSWNQRLAARELMARWMRDNNYVVLPGPQNA